jgi:hypothetical protein
MSSGNIERRWHAVMPPRANQVGVGATSAAAASFDISAGAKVNQFVTVQAFGADARIIFATTSAAALAITMASTGQPGTAANGFPLTVAQGPVRYILEPGQDLFLGAIAAAAGSVNWYFSSAQNQQ